MLVFGFCVREDKEKKGMREVKSRKKVGVSGTDARKQTSLGWGFAELGVSCVRECTM